MKKLRALFIPTSNSGITFWRMYNFWGSAHRQGLSDIHVLWYQKQHGEQNLTHPWERDILNADYMWRITKEVQDWAHLSDVIIFGMLHGPGFKFDDANASNAYVTEAMSLFRALKDMFPEKPIYSEIDDNMLSTPEYNPAGPMYNPNQELRELALTQFKESDGLITSTPYLAEIYRDFNENVSVIPNSIDFALWDRLEGKDRPGIRIGWAGGANHDDDLKILEEIIPAINKLHKNIKWVFLHGCPKYLRESPGVEFHKLWTKIDKYPKKLASLDFDIGIAPLVDNAFNRGKSNLRWLEYSALRIPTVASNVGNFAETIKHSIDGFLADDATQFIDHLDLLIKDRKLRRQIGLSAHERIRKDFNVDDTVKKYVEILSNAKVRSSKRSMELVH